MSEPLQLILKTLSDKKADAIDLYDFSGGHFIHDTMVIASANNPRLLDALSDYVTEALEKEACEIHHTEGTPDSGWILIDTPQILVHLFLQETRDHYQLDVLWADKKASRYAD
mgnify:CR=1 FL=1